MFSGTFTTTNCCFCRRRLYSKVSSRNRSRDVLCTIIGWNMVSDKLREMCCTIIGWNMISGKFERKKGFLWKMHLPLIKCSPQIVILVKVVWRDTDFKNPSCSDDLWAEGFMREEKKYWECTSKVHPFVYFRPNGDWFWKNGDWFWNTFQTAKFTSKGFCVKQSASRQSASFHVIYFLDQTAIDSKTLSRQIYEKRKKDFCVLSIKVHLLPELDGFCHFFPFTFAHFVREC